MKWQWLEKWILLHFLGKAGRLRTFRELSKVENSARWAQQ
jgi:hypothetical protein